MRKPHFIKYAKQRQEASPPVEKPAAGAEGDQGEVVIRADAVFLGSSYPRRLRVVCFEGPAASLNRFAIR